MIRGAMIALVSMGLACGGKSAAEEKAEAVQKLAEARAAEARAKAADLAEAGAARARDTAADVAESAKVTAEAAKLRAEVGLMEAKLLGTRAKAELDKVYRATSDYDLDVTATDASPEHAAKLAALPHVTIGDLTVGYEQVAIVSATGVGRSRHFRCTWRRGDRDVIVGYQTSEELELVAFAALLGKLVPAVETVLP